MSASARAVAGVARRRRRLVGVGLDLAVRLRDEGPAVVHADVARLSAADARDLVLCLAACIDVNQPVTGLLANVRTALRLPVPPASSRQRAGLKPCGTRAAAVRHRARGEDVCGPCGEAERVYDRDAKRARRKRDRAPAGDPTVDIGVPATVSAAPDPCAWPTRRAA